MLIVTGGSGFIGARLSAAMATAGHDVTVVDDVEPSMRPEHQPFPAPYGFRTKDDFRRALAQPGSLRGVEAVLHQGACTSTTEDDEAFLMDNNLAYSAELLAACLSQRVPLVYASSAAVYGAGPRFDEAPGNEHPINGYARSKARFDAAVRAALPGAASPVVGLRYFNVYGPGEAHKGAMASMVLQWSRQLRASGTVRLFGATGDVAAGEQRRDFVHVDDVVSVVRWFLAHPEVSGIYNCGTGHSRSFRELADLVVAGAGPGEVEFIPFPEQLAGRYQTFTEADLGALRSTGCDHEFRSLEAGVAQYLAVLAGSAAES